jgi:hypothetical protein
VACDGLLIREFGEAAEERSALRVGTGGILGVV